MQLPSDVPGRIAADHLFPEEFAAICDFGGRLAGTESERRAMEYVAQRGALASGVPCTKIPVSYGGWRAQRAELHLADGTAALCHPLVRSMPTPAEGLTAEVIDVGRGTPEEFEAHRREIAGRIVLVRHELMFVAGTIHRRRKYNMAREAGAVGFLIAGPVAGALVTGSSGRNEGDAGIPAAGITPETAARLVRTAQGWPQATLVIAAEEYPAQTSTLLFDLPGRSDELIVLSAHVDGHDVNESAMDNASGVATALAVTRAVAPYVRNWRRGVRLAFFSAEEWALTGSARYVAGLSEEDRRRIALNLNLDTVAGGKRLTALTSGFANLEPFLLQAAEISGHKLRCVRPLQTNSDHANFALAGIPALRLVAGYDEPDANVRFVLTPGDCRDKVTADDLINAAQLTAALLVAACNASPAESEQWRHQG
ncbi:MAG TPA: M28 family peptidase [Bradyrhizobium sp.]|uniref:M28 family peptidase n=1 Tax=Bradyrhizobium sp. TaxID=376 RepID=UPI002D7F2CA7|nr:M28 family peptidase [Bradyrhizobium sp.]HET7886787.1 M28 family peptidase [Bradyrhizobium sp.]